MKSLVPLLGFIFSFSAFCYYSYNNDLSETIFHGICSILNILALIYIVKNPVNHKE